MIIQNLIPVTFDRIIPAAEVAMLLTIHEQAHKIHQDSQDYLLQITKEAEQIKLAAYESTVKQLMDSNQQVLKELEDNLENLLLNLKNDLYELVYRVLRKLGIEQLSTEYLQNLLKSELDKFNSPKRLKILANPKLLVELQQVYPKDEGVLEWEEDSSLHDFECICSTNLWTLRLDIAMVSQQIQQVLINNGATNESKCKL